MNTITLPAKATLFALIAFAIAVAVLFAGCAVAIPIPPSGPDMGKYGYFKAGYEPNYLTTPFLETNTTKGLSK
jgi:hypothetical protein